MLCAVTLGFGTASYYCHAQLRTGWFGMRVADGFIGLGIFRYGGQLAPIEFDLLAAKTSRLEYGNDESAWSRPRWGRMANHGGDLTPFVETGLIWLLIPVAAFTAVIWHRARRPPKGHCSHCGYDLTGNESRVCPECGTKL